MSDARQQAPITLGDAHERLPIYQSKHIRLTDSDCWEWNGQISHDGYGRTSINGRQLYAHRVIYEQLVGSIPDGLQMDHLCLNKRCVNPAHVEPVTFAENMRRRGDGRTHCKHGHELTPENTLVTLVGKKRCRTCKREDDRRYKAKRKTDPENLDRAIKYARRLPGEVLAQLAINKGALELWQVHGSDVPLYRLAGKDSQ